ncbi:MAG: GTP-binding protein [Actinomycetota bacterium]|nr:GTP-binding protein [Actinomycetota bacterium]
MPARGETPAQDERDHWDGADGFAPWDGRRVPVTLLGGYLGAGKTTALNALLARTDRPIAVVVNDVGTINVDAALVARRRSDAIELTDGCVCCSMAGGLASALETVRARASAPDHVIVELSGVADPTRLTAFASSTGFRLDSTVVMVDVEQVETQLADPVISDIVHRQLEAADLFLLSKVQLVDTDRIVAVRDRLSSLAPDTPALDVADATESASFLDLGTRRPGGATETPPPQLFDPHETSIVALPVPTTPSELHRLLDELPADVVRAKGIAVDDGGQRLLVQVVGRRRHITELPRAEDQRCTDLVVIRARPSVGHRTSVTLGRSPTR